jgi:hypothetical protein
VKGLTAAGAANAAGDGSGKYVRVERAARPSPEAARLRHPLAPDGANLNNQDGHASVANSVRGGTRPPRATHT